MRSFVTCLISFLLVLPHVAVGQSSKISFPVKRDESAESWRKNGGDYLKNARNRRKLKRRKAKNVILFVGDGMGISTLTAARILEGQLRGESGEENLLSFERFPYSALSRTYSTNQQTPDSAPTMSAMITGIKTSAGLISMGPKARRSDYRSGVGNEIETLVEMAEKRGRSTGVVSTARITHATPAACYAHSVNRGWENDAALKSGSLEAYNAGAKDIARQLIEFEYGDGIDVALGGGRSNFLPNTLADPEYTDRKGLRIDGRDLTKEWVKRNKGNEYVWDKKGFDAIDPKKTKRLLGLFERTHMQYEYDRPKDKAGEPSLAEMTKKAIELLSKNKKGYVLVVEAGRIDHAHHNGNAFRALTDTIALSDAVRTARSMVDLKKTMMVVTADHSHSFTMGGYPARGNNILGLVRNVSPDGGINKEPSLAADKKPYTTLRYADGPGTRKGARPDLKDSEVVDPDFKQEALVPKASETHAGEDVAIFADGVNAWMFAGSMEQSWIFYAMKDALRF